MFLPEDMDVPIWRLTNAMCEGTITGEEMCELELLLESDPTARDFYIDFLIINSEISWMVSARQHSSMDLGPRISTDVLENPTKPKKTPVLDFLGNWTDFFNQHSPLSFVLLFVVLGTMLFATTYFTSMRNSDAMSPEPLFVAQITATKDCIWTETTNAPKDMEALQIGRQLNLEKGLVEIAYSNQAKVVIEGPSCYTVDSRNSGFLRKGKLFARADTEQSRQFTIVTPNANFVDLGTEFGVNVDAKGQSAVAVFSGKVNAVAKRADGSLTHPVSVTRGKSMVCEGGKFISSAARRSDFPLLQTLPPPPPQDASFRRWVGAGRELQNRPDLVAYYNFQPDNNDPNILVNRALTGEAFNGIIQNANWVSGRFPGKNALEFTAADSGVRVNLPGEYRQMTVIAWINNKQFANGLNGILMSDDWDKHNKLHLQIDKERKLILNVRGQVSKRVNMQEYHATIKAIPADYLDNWCMIAGVIDSPDQCTIYVNGEFFETLESTQIPSIRIGSALIGGWNRGSNPVPDNMIRNFSGRIDEIMIFQSLLTAEEIKQIYESGKP
jgi:hypothetical protein